MCVCVCVCVCVYVCVCVCGVCVVHNVLSFLQVDCVEIILKKKFPEYQETQRTWPSDP